MVKIVMRSPVTSVAVRGGHQHRPCPDNQQGRRDSQVTGITTVRVSPTHSHTADRIFRNCHGPQYLRGAGEGAAVVPLLALAGRGLVCTGEKGRDTDRGSRVGGDLRFARGCASRMTARMIGKIRSPTRGERGHHGDAVGRASAGGPTARAT